MTKRTLGGTNKKATGVSGFRSRMRSKEGRKVINNRRRKKEKFKYLIANRFIINRFI